MSRVSVIIPVFNRKDITLQCLDCLGWIRNDEDWRIIVVDDASTDGTAEAITRLHPHVSLLHGNGDLFWTGGIVLGMQEAVRCGTDVLIWLNDDSRPNEPSLRRLAALISEHSDWIIASTYKVDGQAINMNSLCRKAAPKTGREFDDADMLAGNQVAFSRRLVETIGYPDAKRCPHVAGDGTYTFTAHRHGFQVKVDTLSHLDLISYSPYPSVQEIFWRGSKSLAERIETIFFAKRSRYRLPTQWHLDTIHHGILKASLIFPARLTIWLLRILFHRTSK